MRLLLPLLIFLLSGMVFADESGVFDSKRTLRISPLFQNWSVDVEDRSLSIGETSNLVSLYVPVNDQFNFTVSGMQAYVSYDSDDNETIKGASDIENFFGINDVQIAANYYVPNIRAVFGLKANLPTGKRDFVQADYNALADLSNPVFRFQVPSFGQGFNLSPSLIIAQPAGEKAVLGLGLSYTYRGSFAPFDDDETLDLNPGDEFLVTAGIDYKLNQAAKLAADFSFGAYTADAYETDGGGSQDVFQAGNRIRVNTSYKQYFGFHILQLQGVYRSEAKNELLTIQDPSATETIAGSIHFIASFAQRASQVVTIGYSAEARTYQDNKTDLSGGTLFGFALSPQFTVSKDVSIPLLLRYRTASFSAARDISLGGLEAGAGITFRF